MFKTIVEAVLDNGAGEIAREELTPAIDGLYHLPLGWELRPGDTIRIVERETET